VRRRASRKIAAAIPTMTTNAATAIAIALVPEKPPPAPLVDVSTTAVVVGVVAVSPGTVRPPLNGLELVVSCDCPPDPDPAALAMAGPISPGPSASSAVTATTAPARARHRRNDPVLTDTPPTPPTASALGGERLLHRRRVLVVAVGVL
jgi:hypothetical protein